MRESLEQQHRARTAEWHAYEAAQVTLHTHTHAEMGRSHIWREFNPHALKMQQSSIIIRSFLPNKTRTLAY